MNLDKIIQSIRKTDNLYHLIDKKDKIAVGLSGGKDSMILLAALAEMRKYKDYDFELKAIHIDGGFPGMDFSEIDQFCEKNQIELNHEKAPIYETLKKESRHSRLSCSKCSKYRKACMVQAALKHDCNVIAFAHHGDDAIETLFMNMMHGAKITTFQAKIHLNKSGCKLIRPLIGCKEQDIINVNQTLSLPVVKNTCPNDTNSERLKVKNILNELYKEKDIHKNFMKMLNKSNLLK